MEYVDGPNQYILATNNPLFWIDPWGYSKRGFMQAVVDAVLSMPLAIAGLGANAIPMSITETGNSGIIIDRPSDINLGAPLINTPYEGGSELLIIDGQPAPTVDYTHETIPITPPDSGIYTDPIYEGSSDDYIFKNEGSGAQSPPRVDGGYQKPPEQLPGFPEATPERPKAGRARWKTPKGEILEWDSQEGELEKYNKTGKKHLGTFNPDGTPRKAPKKGRTTPK